MIKNTFQQLLTARMLKASLINVVLFTTALLISTASHAWTLNKSQSQLNFVSIKKNMIGEIHSLNDINGEIQNGKASIIINPESVESNVPIRNDRMREFLFNTKLYPSINVMADVQDVFIKLNPGTSTLATIPAQVSLHGQSQTLELVVRASMVNTTQLAVTTVKPVLVRADSFDLVTGIQKLSSLVNDIPIAESVPVTFSLVFEK